MVKEKVIYYCEYCGDTRPVKRSKTCGKQACINTLLEQSMKTVKCEVCTNEFKVKKTVGIVKHCSDECRRKRHLKNCEHCGNSYRTNKLKQQYCSSKCATHAVRERLVTLDCDYCGEEFERPVMGVSDTYLHNFCSKTCRNRHYTQLYYPQERKYGADWYAVRKEVLSYYNNTCQRCGYQPQTKEESIHVHHIIPRQYTKEPNNSLETLLPLCEECHRKTHREHDDWFKETFGDEDIV